MMVTPMIVGSISKMYSDISSASCSYKNGDAVFLVKYFDVLNVF